MAIPRFQILGDLIGVEVIAVGRAIRELARLRKRYGARYEAHGIGRKESKRKRYVEEN